MGYVHNTQHTYVHIHAAGQLVQDSTFRLCRQQQDLIDEAKEHIRRYAAVCACRFHVTCVRVCSLMSPGGDTYERSTRLSHTLEYSHAHSHTHTELVEMNARLVSMMEQAEAQFRADNDEFDRIREFVHIVCFRIS